MPKVEIPKLEAPKDVAGLGVVVEQVKAALGALSEQSGVNADAIAQAGADLKAAKESAEQSLEAARRAEEMAKNAEAIAKGSARSVPGDADRALKSIPMLHRVTATRDWNGFDPLAYNILAMSKPEMDEAPEPARAVLDRVRRLWTVIAVTDHYYRNGRTDVADRYMRAGGWKSLPQAAEFQALEKRIRAVAMDTAESGGGLEWAPTGVLPNLLPDVRPDFEFSGYINEIALPRSPILLPVQGDHFRGSKSAEQTASTSQSQIPTNNLSTLNVTFTAVGVKAMTVYSSELEDDAIVQLATVVPADLRTAIIASIESADVNGQLTGTTGGTTSTFDTGETFVSATDDRHCWDGVRYFGSLTGVMEDMGAGVTVDGLNAIRAGMGKWGKNPSQTVWVTSYNGWAKVLGLKDSAGTAVYLTAEKFGGQGATALTGTLGFLLGSPLSVSDYFPQNLNASGIIDGASNKTGICCVNRRGLNRGVVRMTRLESSREQFFQFDQVAYKVTWRGQLQPNRTPSATFKIVGCGVNV